MKKQKGKWRIFTTSAALVRARAHAHVCMWDNKSSSLVHVHVYISQNKRINQRQKQKTDPQKLNKQKILPWKRDMLSVRRNHRSTSPKIFFKIGKLLPEVTNGTA